MMGAPPPPGGPVGGLTQPASSPFYQPQPSEAQMHRMAAPGPPGVIPGQAAPIMNENVDFSIQIPERMFRLTAGKVPATAAQATASKIPFGAVLRPMAPEGPDDEEVDTIQPGAAGIVRCKRCRTYINPFVIWTEHGRRWRCNICAQINDCPSAYFCHLDEKGLRRDRYERPELSKGAVEFIAPAEYMVRSPQEPSYFFVLDVSATAVRSGMLQCAANAIKASLDDLPGRNRTKVGFITFDNSVHYYNLAPDLASPQMLVVADLKELFVPLPDYLLVNLQESRQVVESFLDSLPEMFARNPVVSQSCLGPALKAAFTVMKQIGGKMCVFQSIMPNLGDGSLKPREQPALMGTPNEVKLLRPEVTWYKDTSVEFSRQQICVDMFIFPYQYMDLASLGELPRFTAGTLRSYVSFNIERDGPRFEEELIKTLTQTTAFEAVMRIRCTKGMRITNFYGNFYIRGSDLLALPNCNTDSVFGFDLAHEEQSLPSNHVTIQAALLYTSSDGERRIRVMTQALPVTSLMSDVVHSVDVDACLTLLGKQAIEVTLKSSLDNARMRLQQICIDILRAAKGGDKRIVSGYQVPPQQHGGAEGEEPSIPENLELLPLYTLAMMKNVAFRGGNDVHPDERVQSHHLLTNMWVGQSKNFIYPRLFSIHTMDDNAGYPADESVGDSDVSLVTAGRNNIVLPPVISLSIDGLSSDGIYLLDNGVEMYLWVGRSADMGLVSSLFGVHTLEDMDPNQLKVLTSGDPFASRFGAITEALRQEESSPYTVSPKINIVREGDTFMEARFYWFLIEDRASFQGGTHSYPEFMQFVNDPNASSGARPPPPGPGGPGGHMMGPGPPGGAMGRGPPPPPGGMGRGPPPPGPPAPPHGGGMPPPQQPPHGMGMGAPPPPQQQPQYGGPPPPQQPQYGAPPPPPGASHAPHPAQYGAPPPPQGGYGAPAAGPPPPVAHGTSPQARHYGGPPSSHAPPQTSTYGHAPPPPRQGPTSHPPAPPGRAVPGPPQQQHQAPPHQQPQQHSGGYAPPPPTNPQQAPRGMPPPPPGAARMGGGGPPPPPPPPPGR